MVEWEITKSFSDTQTLSVLWSVYGICQQGFSETKYVLTRDHDVVSASARSSRSGSTRQQHINHTGGYHGFIGWNADLYKTKKKDKCRF